MEIISFFGTILSSPELLNIFFFVCLVFSVFVVGCLIAKMCLTLCGTPWTVAHQAPLSMGFLRQEYWSGLPFLSPGDLPDPGIKLSFQCGYC